jgi:hypothetical protein
MCEHDWQPIVTWGGRYRCTKCQVVAYRGIASNHIRDSANDKKKVAIIPYRCKGACGKPAQYVSNEHQLCFDHARKRGLMG